MTPHDLTPVWKSIDDLKMQTAELQKVQYVDTYRLSATEKNHAEMCRQVTTTEANLLASINEISLKQDALIKAQYVSEGAKSAVKYIPNVIQFVILLSTVVMLIRGFK